MKRYVCGTLILLGLTLPTHSALAQWKPDTASLAPQAIEIQARPIAGFIKSGGPFESSRLEWRGGLVLSSSSPHFGGWSGLAISRDGTRLLAVSDAGLWMRGELAYDEGGRPEAVRSARIGPLKTRKGNALDRHRDRDAEAIVLASGTLDKGTAYIAFEQSDRIGVFPLGKAGVGKPSSYLTMPKETAGMRINGIEALAVLAGGPNKGALVAFAENPLRGEKTHRGWIWMGGKPESFTVEGIGGFSITDAAALGDGSILVLERRFRWLEGLHIRLRHLAADGVRSSGAATGEVLLDVDTGTEIDNLEGMAVSEGPSGETVITLISDDNFNRFLQRTLLLQFALKETRTARAAEDAAPKDGSAKK